ncbi:hypothetical protein [Inmirania thermothiophila]|uniref:Uncharacterized protein n=1 Tax=Inmirania thermothiophila TaxID=1750597 RepID=A0A3N1Y723_9GAMM|nr:hypothetical protein [Inmirania thermothiophila]ROR34629.1 hypothetical protein EDC57_0529 [Inmirania thermothiophila]
MFRRARTPLLLLAAGLLAACAAARPPPPAEPAGAEGCLGRLEALDAAVAAAGVGDGEAARIPGHPYLRVDRLLASFAGELATAGARRAWLEALRRLDLEARRAELANLPGPAPATPDEIERCGRALVAALAADAGAARALAAAVRVPDEYRTARRVLGLYAVTALPVDLLARRWRRRAAGTFALPPQALPAGGPWRILRPPRAETAPPWPPTRDALGIPRPEAAAARALAARHAPTFVIARAGPADDPGRPRWRRGAARPDVDRGDPVVYWRLAHTRLQGETLLQIVYVVWFPERPRSGPFDLLGGRLDGLTWRVTLDREGRPLAYDVMHNCGCYHMFLPTPRLRPRPWPPAAGEPPFVPAVIPPPPAGAAAPALFLAAGTHQLLHVDWRPPPSAPAARYRLAPYAELRSLPLPEGGRRSLFRPDGIVPGTDRGERWLLWPMGIPHPGAMRQWGHHAIAFVGRRHFDDPFLLEEAFLPAP